MIVVPLTRDVPELGYRAGDHLCVCRVTHQTHVVSSVAEINLPLVVAALAFEDGEKARAALGARAALTDRPRENADGPEEPSARELVGKNSRTWYRWFGQLRRLRAVRRKEECATRPIDCRTCGQSFMRKQVNQVRCPSCIAEMRRLRGKGGAR
jgi:hypothetical protein